ncbi:MAG: hypothetical protein JSS51_04445 [Planctomycetes bacterium]|nr:hypothetical protein [Planctomycetota bacterium]
MSEVGDSLQRSRANLLAAIEDVTANPKPNYKIDGQEVSHSDHLRNLLDSLEQINRQIRENGDGDGQAFEFITEIVPIC